MSTIPISVRSNEDRLKGAQWPTSLACRPMVGDRIMTLDGRHNRKIAGITHCTEKHRNSDQGTPMLLIEVQTVIPIGSRDGF